MMPRPRGMPITPEHAEKLRAFARRPKNKKWRESVGRAWTEEKRAAARARALKQWVETPPGRRFSGTRPELLVQAHLESLGVVLVAQYALGGALYDFAIPSRSLLVEVDGCYWHNCESCGYRGARPEAYRTDKRKNTLALRAGWRLIRIPEHAVYDGSFKGLLAP